MQGANNKLVFPTQVTLQLATGESGQILTSSAGMFHTSSPDLVTLKSRVADSQPFQHEREENHGQINSRYQATSKNITEEWGWLRSIANWADRLIFTAKSP